MKIYYLLFIFLLLIGCCKVNNQAANRREKNSKKVFHDEFESSTYQSSQKSVKNLFDSQVAGAFYPGKKAELQSMIEQFLNQAELNKAILEKDIVGLLSPHAGYRFSAPVAAESYKQVKGKNYKTVVVMAISHRRMSKKIVTLANDAYNTPLGNILIDKSATKELLDNFSDLIEVNESVFMREHSLEVQLPFLQLVLPEVKIVPLILSTRNDEDAIALGDALYKIWGKRKDILFVASSDLSHFLEYDDAVKIDRENLDIISKIDIPLFIQKGAGASFKNGYTGLCGFHPVLALLKLFSNYSSQDRETVIIDYKNSGDTAFDRSKVVGYGSIAFALKQNIRTEKQKAVENNNQNNVNDNPSVQSEDITKRPQYAFTSEEKQILLKIAQKSVESAVRGKSYLPDQPQAPRLQNLGAAFVTLKCDTGSDGRCHGLGEDLRGCIGHIIARIPLYECVSQVAKSAALEDPRFLPINESELQYINYEISVLTAPERVSDSQSIVVGRDGLIMSRGMYRGLLLPQVPGEFGWNREEFLDATCRKAGLEQGCWRQEDTNIERFQAVVWNNR